MKLKKNITLVLIAVTALFLNSCSLEGEEFLSKVFDIEMSVTSTRNNRLSRLETAVVGPDVNLTTQTTSDTNFPFYKAYMQQKISEFTNIDLTVTDNSAGPIGSVFEPYDISFVIRINGEETIKKTATIKKAGEVAYLSYSMQSFFR